MNGRKRHILVDTQGLLMKVNEAGMHDSAGAKLSEGTISEDGEGMVGQRLSWTEGVDENHTGLGVGGGEASVDRGMGGSGAGASESSEGVCGVASALGGGAYLRLAGAQPQTVEGL